MKKLALALLMIFSVPVFAQEDSLSEKMDNCTFNAIKQTQYTMIAAATPDDKKADFDKFIESEVAANPHQASKLVHFLGEMAWKFRKLNPVTVGYSAYRACIEPQGTAT